MTAIENCEDARKQIKEIAFYVAALKNRLIDEHLDSEAIANSVLAYRHLEDASMRLGKAIQALDGGVSIYDKEQVVGAEA
jgi:hypothetical protein